MTNIIGKYNYRSELIVGTSGNVIDHKSGSKPVNGGFDNVFFAL